jgi:hypothetical protein
MTFRAARRGGRGSAPTPAAQIAMVAREFAANDTTLRFSQSDTGDGSAPRTWSSRNPAGTFEFAGAPQAHGPASPPGAARTCVRANSRRPASGRSSRVRVKIIRGTSGSEFIFFNARIGSIGKALNIASCGNAPGSFDVRSLIKGQASGWPQWLPLRSCHFWRGPCR